MLFNWKFRFFNVLSMGPPGGLGGTEPARQCKNEALDNNPDLLSVPSECALTGPARGPVGYNGFQGRGE